MRLLTPQSTSNQQPISVSLTASSLHFGAEPSLKAWLEEKMSVKCKYFELAKSTGLHIGQTNTYITNFRWSFQQQLHFPGHFQTMCPDYRGTLTAFFTVSYFKIFTEKWCWKDNRPFLYYFVLLFSHCGVLLRKIPVRSCLHFFRKTLPGEE